MSKRFDRNDDNQRVHMASSLTLLGFADGDGEKTGKGYLDIVDFIVSSGGRNVGADLEELYRRVAFNICLGNTDDHFRNHAFLLAKGGWELSPAYDMNPTNSLYQALLIDSDANDSDLNRLFETHEGYLLDETAARRIIGDVTRNMRCWKAMAQDVGLSRGEMAHFAERFEKGMNFHYGK